jgi:hypothetical protein
MESLKEAILCLEPKIDLLHDCLGFGRFAEVTVTSDGHFLGRAWGDIGFNHFLGAPSQAAIERTQDLFMSLPRRHKDKVIQELMMRGIAPDLLGLLSAEPKN